MSGRVRIKQGRASLVGGIAVGAAAFILRAAIAHELRADTVPWLVLGAIVSGCVGAWIRLADL